MFGSKSNGSTNENGEVSSGTNIIVVGTVIKGDISSKNDTRIDGNLEGDLKCSARLLLGEKGKVIGNIESNEAIIEGNVKGNVSISGILTLKSSAQIKGDIYTKKLIVESGAVINGQCSMDADGQYKAENGKQKEKPTGKKEKSNG
ncbi:MAG: polymer-forming cytoskeletal protein [Bacteroidetes bacterium]|jgi:cytoskeletal protein CcmA (bactofilin family)|nr:polymer-forming cytoskeletal protein [Bacteroidota bacterium]